MMDVIKILIVDDERLNIKVLNDLLKPHYKIMAAVNGEKALNAARGDSPPDLILLDIMMPDMDGYEVCRQLKADPQTRDIPVIFVTAMGQDSDETKGLELGAADYLTKPISPPIVLARVRTQLELLRNMRELHTAYALIERQKLRMQDELDVGRDIQLGMLPRLTPTISARKEFGLSAVMNAALEVGGDFYDFFLIDDDHLCVCVADVSGKGVAAALFMAVAKVLLKSRASSDLSPASVLTHANEQLSEDNDSCMFVTIFLAIIDLRTGEVRYTNAGHNPPYIRRANGDIERIDARHGPVAGALAGIAYGESRLNLERDDTLLLFTDGVTEAMNSEHVLFDEDRLLEVLNANVSGGPDTLVQEVVARVKSFEAGAPQTDDVTVLALQFFGRPSGATGSFFDLKISNHLSELDRATSAFEAFADEHDAVKPHVGRVLVVLDELLNNIISYGYEDEGEHYIQLRVELDTDRLKLTISDDAIPYNPVARVAPRTDGTLEDRDIGGLGVHLVKNMMDEFSYRRRVNENVLTLTKLLS